MKTVLTRESHVDVSEAEPVQTPGGSSVIPLTSDTAKEVQIHKEDPWITLIERLWEANPYSDWVPVDVGEILNDYRLLWLDTLRHPFRLLRLSNNFVQQSSQVTANSTLALWGLGEKIKPVIEPEAGDKRSRLAAESCLRCAQTNLPSLYCDLVACDLWHRWPG